MSTMVSDSLTDKPRTYLRFGCCCCNGGDDLSNLWPVVARNDGWIREAPTKKCITLSLTVCIATTNEMSCHRLDSVILRDRRQSVDRCGPWRVWGRRFCLSRLATTGSCLQPPSSPQRPTTAINSTLFCTGDHRHYHCDRPRPSSDRPTNVKVRFTSIIIKTTTAAKTSNRRLTADKPTTIARGDCWQSAKTTARGDCWRRQPPKHWCPPGILARGPDNKRQDGRWSPRQQSQPPTAIAHGHVATLEIDAASPVTSAATDVPPPNPTTSDAADVGVRDTSHSQPLNC